MKKQLLLIAFTLLLVLTLPSKGASKIPSLTSSNMKFTILILYRANHQWLSLSREQRGKIFEQTVLPLVEKYQEHLTVRFFDSEAHHARTSDFLIIECDELKWHYFFIEELRDTALFGKPYIEVNDIIVGHENGFQEFEEAAEKNQP
ncbi:darcynin family protein [Rapidithrix thailandica]|uniref:Darcynin family protein n=1 Tax=Rapidithrix thailandica TaxID=413964 RepID=A0AAW9RZP9_9BACT